MATAEKPGTDNGAFVKWNIDQKLEGHPPRTNFNVMRLDGTHNIRLARVVGRFPWHKHLNGDEGWLVWRGRLRIDIEGRESITLNAGEGTMIPKGVVHSPICEEEGTTVVVFNVDNFQHEFRDANPELGNFAEHNSY